jgi:hypothetical protein
MTAPFKPGDRVSWRGRLGTVTSDYWRHRDRFSVRFDGDDHDLDFGAEALRPVRQAENF